MFLNLKNLKYGDRVQIRAWGKVYTYQVRENRLIRPDQVSVALQHKGQAWITLLTCESYNLLSGTYSWQRMVRAVLVSVGAGK